MSKFQNPYEMFKTDKDSEVQGILLNYGGFRVLVARAGGRNQAWAKALTEMAAPFLDRKGKLRGLDTEKADDLFLKVVARSVILDWETLQEDGSWERGIVMEDGELHSFNEDNVVKILQDLPDLFLDIREQAEDANNFRAEAVGDAVKK